MAMPFESTPIWAEVRDIFNANTPITRFEYKATVHTEKEDIEVMKFIQWDIIRDYVNNVGDMLFLEVVIPLGKYIKRIYPYRDNLEITITRKRLGVSGSAPQNASEETRRYKALLIPDTAPKVQGTEFDQFDEFTLDLGDIPYIQFQLLDRSLEPFRVLTVGGNFEQAKPGELITSVTMTKAKDILVDGKPALDGIDLVEPDNDAKRPWTTIPHALPLTSLPTYLQEKMGGVYRFGIGSYLQYFDQRATWFVYPLYTITRFFESVKKVIFYSVPKTRYQHVERTYRVDGDTLHIAIMEGKQYVDDGEASMVDTGIGYRQVDARAVVGSKPVEIKDGKVIAKRHRTNTEVTLKERKDGVNFTPASEVDISSNNFSRISRIARKLGTVLPLIWHNSDFSLLYPGMPAQYVFMANDEMKTLEGVLIFNHTSVEPDAPGVMSRTHNTTTFVTLFVSKYDTETSA